MPLTPEAFVKKYRTLAANERAAAQTHFNDLCELLGVPKPLDYDPAATEYRFEKPVLKTAGGKGFADVWWRGRFGWEYKGKGADLKKAYGQLLSYREDLENPPLLVVSDMQTIQVHTNFTGTQKVVREWKLDDLLDEGKRGDLRKVWTEPGAFNPAQRIEQATVGAVKDLAEVSDELKGRGVNPDLVAHFLVRTMFTLFAEDVDLIPEGTFGRLLAAAHKYPEDFRPMCEQLFAAMSTGGLTVAGRIPYINGGVFENTSAPDLKLKEIGLLQGASRRSWRQIDPTIFGTLFELVIDPTKRWQLGAHYTPLADILDVVQPVVMRPLRAEWERLRGELRPLIEEIEKAHAGGGDLYSAGALGQSQVDEAVRRLTAFQDRLATVTVLDPAMGSGNFLYVTLRLLLDLEAEVRATIRGLTQDVSPLPKVSPRQMRGIEVNPYAHEIAGMVLWIGYLQWMREHGEERRASPVLEKLPGLVRQDAVYDRDTGQAPPWPEAEFIVGNPPFLGYSPMREQLGAEYVEGLRAAYAGRVPGFSDFVCFFFEQAREQVERGVTKRVGLIATNSITGGENARVLERILETGAIFRAWPDRAWIQSGAAVRTSVVMFDDGRDPERMLLKHTGDERRPEARQTVEMPVGRINADLSSGPDLRSARRLRENEDRAFIGVVPGVEHFVIPGATARAWMTLPNPDGVSNAEVLRPFKVGEDITEGNKDRYIVDFSEMTLEQAEKYEEPMALVRTKVKPEKEKTNERHSRERWWQFKRTSPAMRAAIAPLPRYLGTSRVSKFRTFAWLPAGSIPADLVVVVAAAADYIYGVLNSTPHGLWAHRAGTFMGKGNDPRYTPSTTFETFPFPRPTPEGREAVEKAARQIENLRTHLKGQRDPRRATDAATNDRNKTLTLTGIYNLLAEYRETGRELVTGLAALDRAHTALDAAVAAAYGWAWPLPEDELLGKLLALNLLRAAVEDVQREQEAAQAKAQREVEKAERAVKRRQGGRRTTDQAKAAD